YTGEITFYARKTVRGKPVAKNSGSNSILRRVGNNVEYDKQRVACTTLDDYFQDADKNNIVLWIDVEGATLQVLNGGRKVLGACSLAFVEVSDQTFWKDELAGSGVIEYMYGLGFIPVARDFQFVGQYNVIFARWDALKTSKPIRQYLETY